MEASPSTMKGMTYQLRQNVGNFEVGCAHFAMSLSVLTFLGSFRFDGI
jgi:hypothetical protein